MAIPFGKTKAIGALTLGGLTIAGIPAAMFFLNSSSKSNEENESLKELLEQLPDLLSVSPEQMNSDYKALYKKVLETLPQDIRQKYESNPNTQEQNSNLREILSHGTTGIPIALYDSVTKDLSAQNASLIYKIMKHEKFQETWTEVKKVLDKNKELVDKITQIETDGILKVIGLVVSKNEMDSFLTKVKSNAQTIYADTTKSYCDTKTLIIDILIGQEDLSKNTSIKDSLDKIKDDIQSAGITDTEINKVKEKLDKLKIPSNTCQKN